MGSDLSFWQQICQFSSALLPHWFTLVTGFSVSGIIEWHRRKKRHWKWLDHPKVHAVVKILPTASIIITILIASFLAFEDEVSAFRSEQSLYQQADKEKDKLTHELALRTPTGQEQEIDNLKSQVVSLTEQLNRENESKQPRTLDKEKLIAVLKKEGGKYVTVVRHSSDLESQGFADDITDALEKAGWDIKPPTFRIITRDAPGIFIAVNDVKKPAPNGAVVLQDALKSVGLESNGVSNETVPEGQFEVYVGPKFPTK